MGAGIKNMGVISGGIMWPSEANFFTAAAITAPIIRLASPLPRSLADKMRCLLAPEYGPQAHAAARRAARGENRTGGCCKSSLHP